MSKKKLKLMKQRWLSRVSINLLFQSNVPRLTFKKIILTSFLLYVGHNVIWASGNFIPSDDWDFSGSIRPQSTEAEAIFKTEDHVQHVKREAEKQKVADSPVTFLIGRTGAGKTKANHLLNNRKLYAELNPEVREYCLSTTPGDSAVSFKPDTIEASLENRIIDLPGIQNIGSKKPEKSAEIIRDSYELKQLLNEFRRFRLMVVVPEGDLDLAGRAEKFIDMVSRLDEIFPTGLSSYQDRLYFMASHAEAITSPSIFKNRVKLAIESRGSKGDRSITTEEEKILTFISNLPDDRISVFPKPKQDGIVSGAFLSPFMTANPTVAPYADPIEICVSVSAQKYLSRILQYPVTAANNLLDQFTQNLKFRVPPFFHNIPRAMQGASAGALRAALKKAAETLEQTDNATQVHEVLGEFSPPTAKNFVECTKLYERYSELMPRADRVKFRMDNGKMYEMAQSLKAMSKKPTWIDAAGETVWGSYVVGASDVAEYLNGKARDEFATKSVVGMVDSSVHFPGMNWVWSSSLLKIAQQRIIDLSGKHAEAQNNQSQNHQVGKDGSPGVSAESGGHFVGVFDTEGLPLSLLGFKSNGGNGSNGLRGHKGKDGQDGKDEEPEKRTKSTFGEIGDDGGKGGKGGDGGYPGSIRLMKSNFANYSLPWEPSLKFGQNGKDGEPGEPGEGGKHGRVLKASGTLIKPSGKDGETRYVDYLQPVARITSGALCGAVGTVWGLVAGKWPWYGAVDGVHASQEGIDHYYNVHKILQEPRSRAAAGKKPVGVNTRGWYTSKPKPIITDEKVKDVLNFGWEWSKVTSAYKEAK